MESDRNPARRHSDTMRIDIRPEDIGEIESSRRKKIVVQRRRPGSKPGSEQEPEEMSCALGGTAFQKLLHNIYDAVVITDIEGYILSANERATVFFDLPEKELCQRAMAGLISGADENLIPTILRNLAEDRFTLVQADCIRGDGDTFPAEISANRIELAEHDCITFFIRDVTRRKAQEEQLRTGYYAIQNSGSGIMITDPECHVTYANPAMCKLLGCEGSEPLKNSSVCEMFVGDGILAAMQYLEENPYWSGELEIEGLSGRRCFVYVSIVKNISTENLLTGFIFSFMDVTAEREANLKLEAYAAELRRKNQEMKKDLAMARDIQRALLPRHYPQYRGADGAAIMDFGHIYVPSGEIGGDFFDVIPLSEDRLGLFIADVSGHGMRAALITATLRGMVEELATASAEPQDFMRALNQAYTSIFHISRDFSFVTAIYAVLDTRAGAVEFSLAGHPEPIVIRSSRQVERVAVGRKRSSPAIGLLGDSDVDFANFCAQLHSGDALVLYTDGIFEELGADGEEYGLERFENCLARHADKPLDDILDGVVSDVRSLCGRDEFMDDVCMLAVAFDRQHQLKL
jgi:PAS domain S-box-containing protein